MPDPGLVQDDRPIQIGTPLGQDVLLVTAFSGREGLGEMFDFHIDVISEKTSIEVRAQHCPSGCPTRPTGRRDSGTGMVW